MPRSILTYVRLVDRLNRAIGRFAMHLVFVIMGVLLHSALSRTLFDAPLIWSVEVAQMTLAAYYLLGGGYSLQLDSHVRMDLLYGRWSPSAKAVLDCITAVGLVAYLAVLLYGGVSSTLYALEYGQRNYSVWAPPLAPIKILMTCGIALMLLQVVALFFRDLAAARGRPIP